ncbi:hypothetical protein BCR44DRAFT_1431143 [Catenaria anguillulae PL171]|uniref:Uncharacterized protein n=1 Tax=Catenaria anguillulae PL171 TaxID=765915 RepID=A0A1Y2HUY1_9FUNG|nr:hypothetical protein BCR44DRAFT_1431143 [Catenaria anguillulae PL171]
MQQQQPLRGPPPMPALPAPLDPMRRGRPGRSPNVAGGMQQQPPPAPANSANGYPGGPSSSSPSPFAAFDSVPPSQIPLPSLPPPISTYAQPQQQPSMYQQGPAPPIPPRSPAPMPQLQQQAPMLSMTSRHPITACNSSPLSTHRTDAFGSAASSATGGYNFGSTAQPPPSGIGLLSSTGGGAPFPASTSYASLGSRPKSASVSGLMASGQVINGPQLFQQQQQQVPSNGSRSSSARGSIAEIQPNPQQQQVVMNMSTPPVLPVQLPAQQQQQQQQHHRRAPSLPGSSSSGAGTPSGKATPPPIAYRTTSPNPYYAGGPGSKPPGAPRVHRADRFRHWLDKYFRDQVFKRKYLARLVTESWRLHLAGTGTPCMSYWLDRVAQIVPANGVLATLRALLLMVGELVARRGDIARLAAEWERAKYAVIDEFAVVYARWLVNVLDFHARVQGMQALSDAHRVHLAAETHAVIQHLEPYFLYLFERGGELVDKYPWEEVHDAVIMVLEAAYAAYMQHICLMRTLDRARDVKARALAEGLMGTSTYIGHLSIASAKALVVARVEAEGYRVPKHRPSTDLNASWSQPPSMLPKVMRRLRSRGIDASALVAQMSGKQPPACRPEYGSVYDAAQRDFAESSDSD